VTDQCGANGGYGTLYKVSTNGTLTVLHAFTDLGDGGYPYTDGLIQANDGNLYGTTLLGGSGYGGTVFRITTDGTLTTLYAFLSGSLGGTNGDLPKSGLVQGSDGNLYGTTQDGGTNFDGTLAYGDGTVFKITTNGVFTLLAYLTGANGASPIAPLIQGTDGNFYGTTSQGGTNGLGTAFRITPDGTLTSLYSFTNPSGYISDLGGLVQGSDGSFYGSLPNGGTYGRGSIFRLTVVGPPAPAFQSVTQSNGTLALAWSTEAGATYQVQYTADSNSTNWTNLGGPITATGTVTSATDSVMGDSRRFYRVAVLP
jgi:uncharacterized repeat protein (TIGR03803 family)